MPFDNIHEAMRHLSLFLLLLATQAQAGAADTALAQAKKMTRCAWMLISSARDVKDPSPAQQLAVQMNSGLLISRSAELGGSRPIQEDWMKEVARQASTATLGQKLGLFAQWMQCRALVQEEAARALEAAKRLENPR